MKRHKLAQETLEELRDYIDEQAEYVGEKPYSHNIISLTLLQIAKRFGHAEANRAIGDFGLDLIGWSKHEEEES